MLETGVQRQLNIVGLKLGRSSQETAKKICNVMQSDQKLTDNQDLWCVWSVWDSLAPKVQDLLGKHLTDEWRYYLEQKKWRKGLYITDYITKLQPDILYIDYLLGIMKVSGVSSLDQLCKMDPITQRFALPGLNVSPLLIARVAEVLLRLQDARVITLSSQSSRGKMIQYIRENSPMPRYQTAAWSGRFMDQWKVDFYNAMGFDRYATGSYF